MHLAINRRIDRALNFSALWIGCNGLVMVIGPVGVNYEHSAVAGILPEVPEVVTRILGPSMDSVATTMLSVLPPQGPLLR